MKRDSQRVVANVVILFVRQLTTWSLTTVLFLFVPRYLGDQGLGQITFASSFTGMFSFVISLGVTTFVAKEVARDRAKLAGYFFNSLAMRTVLSALVFLIVFVNTNAMNYSPQARMVLYIMCLTTILMCLNDAASSVLQGIENMKWQSAAEVAGKVVMTGGGILVLVNGHGVVTYALVLLTAMSINLAANLSYFFLRIRIRPRLDLKVWRTLLYGGFPFLLTSIMSNVYQRVDATLLGFMTTEAVVGWYGAAIQLLGSLNFVPALVATAVLPALSRMHSSDPNRVVAASRKGISLIIAVSWPMAIGTIMISDKVIEVLHFPESFNNTVPLLAILAVNLPLTGMLTVIGAVVIASDRQRQWAKVTAVGVTSNVLLNLLGIPAAQAMLGNGAIGSAAASVASEALILGLAVRLLPKGVLDRSVLKLCVKSLAGAGIMGIVVWSAHAGNIAVVIALGVIVYGVFSLLVKAVETEDLRLVRDVILKQRLGVSS